MGPLRRLAAQQHRLGALAQPLLGHAAADLALRGRAPHVRRVARRPRIPCGAGPLDPRPAPARSSTTSRSPASECGGDRDARARGDRRLVRQRRDAVRAVRLPAPRAAGVRRPLPRRLHLRGDRPDARLVLHAHGGRHARLRPVLVQDRALPRPHPRRGGPQDEQAPRQRPRADPADGRARRRRGALVHARRRVAVAGAPGRSRHDPGGRAQDAADLLEHRVVPGPLRARGRLRAGHDAPLPRSPSGRRSTGGRSRRRTGSRARSTPRSRRTTRSGPVACSRRTSTTCRTGTCAVRGGGSGRATRPRSRRCTSACTS